MGREAKKVVDKKLIPITFHISREAYDILNENLEAVYNHFKKRFGEEWRPKKKDMLNLMLKKAGRISPKEFLSPSLDFLEEK